MNTNAHHHDFHPEHDRAGLEPEIQRIESLLSLDARRLRVPRGLVERTFDASVQHLPAPKRRSLTFIQPQPVDRSVLSRLAMAAAVGLAVIVGVMFLRSPNTMQVPAGFDQMAHNGAIDRSATTVVRPAVASQLSADREWLLLDAVHLSHYSDVRHLSWSDINDDMASLVRELEM